MDFAHPKILYFLLLIPTFIGLYLLARFARRRKLRRFGDIEQLQPLMPHASRYKSGIKITLELIALAAIIVALARPRGGEKESEQEHKGIEVMIAFDVSRSMLASASDDQNGISRIDRAKFLLDKLISRLDNDRVGLIVFAGNSYTLLPITTDFVSASVFLNDVNTNMVATQGTDIGAAISMALNSFTPAKDVNKAIVLITDSEDHEAQASEMAKVAKEAGIQVDVIGVGTTKGAPIPLNAARGEFLKDENGNVVTTALNPKLGEEIAQAGGGVYINGSASDAVTKVTQQLDQLQKADLGTVKYKSSAEKFPLFIWIALIALIADIFILERKIGWLEKINFFSKDSK
jgi:Ca-activated chloride channel family protein